MKRILTSPARFAIVAAVVILVMSTARVITGAIDITSPGASGATLRFTIPLLLAGLGGLWAERAGVINIGLEGMMIAGTWLGAWFGFLYGPVIGFLCAAVGGALVGLFHGILTVKIGIDQAVSGLAINLLAAGTTRYLSGVYFIDRGGDISLSPPVRESIILNLPGVGDWLLKLHAKQIFFISDLAGILNGLVSNVSLVTVLFLFALPITSFLLWRSRFGLRMRFCGENPVAAESLGVNVYRTRYIALSISGMLAALGGSYLSMVATTVYREGQTAGRGFIGLATVIFGNWRPGGVAAGSLLFGFTDALRIRQSTSVHAMMLVIAMLAIIVVIVLLVKKKFKQGLLSISVAVATGLIYFFVAHIPDEFVTFFPNLMTLLVLTFLSQRLRPPAMAGAPYRKGEESS